MTEARRASLALVLALGLLAVGLGAQARAGRTVDIYVVDVEGGNATLFVSPSGRSMLIDSGNGGRDAHSDPELHRPRPERRG